MDWDRLVCLLIGHDDEEYGDVESPVEGATYRYCHRCGREDPRTPW